MVLREYTIISLNIHICYSNRAYLHSYCKCVYYYFINFFSHLCSHQSLFPHILSTPPNHHSITTATTHDISITKSTKNIEKSNQKSIQTQNQTFNGKLNNLEPKIKLSTKNPSTQTQTQIEATVTTAMESLLQPLERRETSA